MANDVYKTPEGQKGLTQEDLNKFSLDANNQLHWNGTKIKSESTLSKAQKLWAFSLATLGAASAIAVIANIFTILNKEYCWVAIGSTCQTVVVDDATGGSDTAGEPGPEEPTGQKPAD